MRTSIILVATLLSAAFHMGCGREIDPSACSGAPFKGTWSSISPAVDTITMSANCMGAGSYCGLSFEVLQWNEVRGLLDVAVTTSNEKTGCMTVGEYRCSYDIINNSLTLNCGEGFITYSAR